MESVPEARPVAVYDANVLYPAHLRDLLMRLAVGDLVRAHWSEQIHEEWMGASLDGSPGAFLPASRRAVFGANFRYVERIGRGSTRALPLR